MMKMITPYIIDPMWMYCKLRIVSLVLQPLQSEMYEQKPAQILQLHVPLVDAQSIFDYQNCWNVIPHIRCLPEVNECRSSESRVLPIPKERRLQCQLPIVLNGKERSRSEPTIFRYYLTDNA